MAFVFPNLPKLSLWDIACGQSGQNAADLVPTNETRHRLAELVKAASEHKLFVEFSSAGDDSGLFIEFMPAAPRAAVDVNWRKLDGVAVRRDDWASYEKQRMESASGSATVNHSEAARKLKMIDEEVNYWALRQPAPLFGEGFSDELRKQTTLTKYLQYDTWPPAAAAMLVCGLQAPITDGVLSTEIPAKGAFGLDSCFFVASQDPFREAKRVLGIWRSQENPPEKVRPLDFIRWCQDRGFDTAWLRSISYNGGSSNFGPESAPSARELSTIGLSLEEWNQMTDLQRHGALRAIAATKANSEQCARQEKERRAQGRYTLSGAAKSIAATGERVEPLLEVLCGAALRGELPTHGPGEFARYRYNEDRVVRPYYEHVYWNDLNAWLEQNEPRVTFRFPRPEAQDEPVAQEERKVVQPSAGLLATGDHDAPNTKVSRTSKHVIGARSNPLKAVIEKAKSLATDSADVHSVWAALMKLAQSPDRPAPLLGFVEAEGVKWERNGIAEFFTRKNLADRMRRARAR